MAVIEVSDEIVNVHGPVPEHGGDHPVWAYPTAGVGVSVMDVPEMNFALHVAPQLIPPGLLRTLPLPAMFTPRL